MSSKENDIDIAFCVLLQVVDYIVDVESCVRNVWISRHSKRYCPGMPLASYVQNDQKF